MVRGLASHITETDVSILWGNKKLACLFYFFHFTFLDNRQIGSIRPQS